MLSATNISFSYGTKEILRDVSVDFPKGSFTCVIGQNGAGKTTLLRLLGGMLQQDSGTITLDEQQTPFPSGWVKDRLSYLPHRPDVLFPFTAREVVEMGERAPLLTLFRSREPHSIEVAMREADCFDYADRNLSELSAGEQQRVFFAQSIVSEPKVLLLDEPTSSLDIGHQLELMRKLRDWAEDGKTVVAVVHDINLAACFANRLCFLKAGSKATSGTVEEVFKEDLIEATFGVRGEVHKQGAYYWKPSF